jgi:vanillate O-demethylase monooxygenase subunit
MIGWDSDFPQGRPHAVTALGETIVVWRSADGLHALEDRCPHRAAPLSLGRCEEGRLRCLYHGLVFDGTGACVGIPGQDTVSPQVRAKSYPLAEAHSAVWLWPGDPARADLAMVPPFVGYRSESWAMTPGRLDYAAPARLIHDNLLDLSHIAYVHADSFAGGNPQAADKWLTGETRTTTIERGVRVERWIEGMPSIQAGGGKGSGSGDVFSSYDFVLPGVFLQTTARYAERTLSGGGERRSQMSTFTCQAVLPIDAERACYFFAYGPWAQAAELKDFFAELGRTAFEEDRQMIEAQWQVLRADPSFRPLPLAMDQALLKRKLREETAARENQAA